MAVPLYLPEHTPNPRLIPLVLQLVVHPDQVVTTSKDKLLGDLDIALLQTQRHPQLVACLQGIAITVRVELRSLTAAVSGTGSDQAALSDVNPVPGAVEHGKGIRLFGLRQGILEQFRANQITPLGINHYPENIGLHGHQPHISGIGHLLDLEIGGGRRSRSLWDIDLLLCRGTRWRPAGLLKLIPANEQHRKYRDDDRQQ